MELLCRGIVFKKRVRSGGKGMLRDIYPIFLQYHHLLPDQVGRQNPIVLFKLLDSMGGEQTEYANEHLKMFYGEEV